MSSSNQEIIRLRQRLAQNNIIVEFTHRFAATLDAMATPKGRMNREVGIVPRKTQLGQLVATMVLRSISGLRWLTWIALGNAIAAPMLGLDWLPQAPWWLIALGIALLISPPGRIALSALGARAILAGITPGNYFRGGKIHMRVWLAEHFVDELGGTSLACAPFVKLYARALGATIAKDCDLHALPPVTGFLDIGSGAAVEPEVELRGHWIDGERFHLGHIRIRAGARIGAWLLRVAAVWNAGKVSRTKTSRSRAGPSACASHRQSTRSGSMRAAPTPRRASDRQARKRRTPMRI